MKNSIYVGLGSNLGNKLENLRKAIDIIEKNDEIFILKKSSVYRSEPWQMKDSKNFFYNAVIEVTSTLSAEDLLNLLQATEKELGRGVSDKTQYKDRVIDLDIIFFNNTDIETERLVVPIKNIESRSFVLKPLKNLTGDISLPSGKKISQALAQLTDQITKVTDL